MAGERQTGPHQAAALDSAAVEAAEAYMRDYDRRGGLRPSVRMLIEKYEEARQTEPHQALDGAATKEEMAMNEAIKGLDSVAAEARCVCGTRNAQMGCERHKTGVYACDCDATVERLRALLREARGNDMSKWPIGRKVRWASDVDEVLGDA